jgi:hypothetical protein
MSSKRLVFCCALVLAACREQETPPVESLRSAPSSLSRSEGAGNALEVGLIPVREARAGDPARPLLEVQYWNPAHGAVGALIVDEQGVVWRDAGPSVSRRHHFMVGQVRAEVMNTVKAFFERIALGTMVQLPANCRDCGVDLVLAHVQGAAKPLVIAKRGERAEQMDGASPEILVPWLLAVAVEAPHLPR